MRVGFSIFCGTLALICCTGLSFGQTLPLSSPRQRIVEPIDENRSFSLRGNVHPLTAASAAKTLNSELPMEQMILSLNPDPAQEAELAQLIAAQNSPKSPQYHHFLTPAEYGARFGIAQADLNKVIAWLRSYGFTIDEVPASRRSIVFSGTSGQVESAFKTEIRGYSVQGQLHFANARDPEIPAALSGVVGGVVKLHNFRHQSNFSKSIPVTEAQLAHPDFTSGASHYLAPADYATIYDINPLYSAGINGTGQSIAIIARANISISDVQSFRSSFGLPANNPTIVLVNTNPGILQGDSTETTLDTEWSGAVARNAAIKVVVAASTNTADGIDLSAQYAVNKERTARDAIPSYLIFRTGPFRAS